MHCFEIFIAQSSDTQNGNSYDPTSLLIYTLPDEAHAVVEPILAPYDQEPGEYFDRLNYGRPPAPWALACLDREHAIAGHIATSRRSGAGISFAPYRQIPRPMPHDFVPKVGVLTFASKSGLESVSDASPIFAAAWDALRKASSERQWLVVLDAPAPEWLAQVEPGDDARWRASRNAPAR